MYSDENIAPSTPLAGLNTRIAGLNTRIAGLNNRLAGFNTPVADFKTPVSSLNTSIASLNTRITSFNTPVSALTIRRPEDSAPNVFRVWISGARGDGTVAAQILQAYNSVEPTHNIQVHSRPRASDAGINYFKSLSKLYILIMRAELNNWIMGLEGILEEMNLRSVCLAIQMCDIYLTQIWYFQRQ